MGVEDGVTVAAFCFAFALVIASAFLYENIKLINTHTCITCNYLFVFCFHIIHFKLFTVLVSSLLGGHTHTNWLSCGTKMHGLREKPEGTRALPIRMLTGLVPYNPFPNAR